VSFTKLSVNFLLAFLLVNVPHIDFFFQAFLLRTVKKRERLLNNSVYQTFALGDFLLAFLLVNVPRIDFFQAVLLRTVNEPANEPDVCPWRKNGKAKTKMIINYQNYYAKLINYQKPIGNGLDNGSIL
jgi:hypothetical protein